MGVELAAHWRARVCACLRLTKVWKDQVQARPASVPALFGPACTLINTASDEHALHLVMTQWIVRTQRSRDSNMRVDKYMDEMRFVALEVITLLRIRHT
jgi:hypothetical protein